MSTFIAVLIGIIIVCPFLLSIWLSILKKWTGRQISMKRQADYTTPFLFVSVYIIARTLFGSGVGYIISIIAITIVLLYAIYEKRRVKDFKISPLLRKVWRLYFVILVISYLVLIIIGVVGAIIHAVSS